MMRFGRLWLQLMILVFVLNMPGLVTAQINKEPEELKGVEVTEHLDAKLPLMVPFKNSNGQTVNLGQYFDGEQPVILTLVYYRCPMLCGLLLDGLIEGIKEVPLSVGQDYKIVTLSFDPLETPMLAQVNKQRLVKAYGRPEAANGWHFLTGDWENINQVVDTVGFGFTWNEKRKEYAHVAVVMICKPDGRISRYLYGIEFDPKTLRLSLVEASEGKVGSTLDKIILTCFRYDPDSNSYAFLSLKIMRLGGGLTILILGAVMASFWMKEIRRNKQRAVEEV
jgi:protein SCO1